MYPNMKPHVLLSLRASMNDFLLPRFSDSAVRTVTPCSTNLAVAIALSRSVSLFDVAGKSSNMKVDIPAQPIVATPSTINNHRQPRRPWAPSKPPVMAPASNPPNAPERMAAEMNTANLLDCSSLLSFRVTCQQMVLNLG